MSGAPEACSGKTRAAFGMTPMTTPERDAYSLASRSCTGGLRPAQARTGASVRRLRVAVDIGGTFTDLVAYDEDSDELITVKTPSTPPTFIEGVLGALEKAEITPEEIVDLQARLDDRDQRDHRAPRGEDRAGHDQGLPRRARRRPGQPPGPLQLQLGPLPTAGADAATSSRSTRAGRLRGHGARGAQRGRRPRGRAQVQAARDRVGRGRVHQLVHAARPRAAHQGDPARGAGRRASSSAPRPRSCPRSASSSAPRRSPRTPT